MIHRSAKITTDIAEAANQLLCGDIVAFPTETVYGLGADATNSRAVAKIFEVKSRPAFDPLIVHVAETSQLDAIVCEFPHVAQQLATAFWPGPLTLVLPKRPCIPDLVTAGLPGVGVRIPSHPVARQLLGIVARPIAAPSANVFGRISPTTAAHVRDGLGDKLDLILDGGPAFVGLESTIISLMGQRPILLRPGGCPLEDIEQIIGPVDRAMADPLTEDAAQPAPGMLSRHYAPRTPLVLVEHEAVAKIVPGMRCGLLTEGTRSWKSGFEEIELLSDDGNLRTSASNFFAALRKLDAAHLDVIVAHRLPNTGLGLAMNDRLQRAAAGSSANQLKSLEPKVLDL